jgi:hypothetical protein
MSSQIMKNMASNPSLFLVFGLLAGMLFNHLASGVLVGLLCHLIIKSFYYRNHAEQADE